MNQYVNLDPKQNIDPYVDSMPLSSFPRSLLEETEILHFECPKCDDNESAPIIFGSSNYRIQKYFADIDLRQPFKGVNSIEELVKLFEIQLKKIVDKINKLKTHYVTEIKAGLDMRYLINVGKLINGRYTPDNNLLYNVRNLYNNKLLSNLEYFRITYILDKGIFNSDAYDVIHYTLRNKYIIRWSADEILDGKKILPGNSFIYLKDALKMNTPTKIDMIAYYDGKFIEITNFIILSILHDGIFYPLNKNMPINETELVEFLNDGLTNEIEKLYYSNLYYSPFKGIKRMYALARFRRDENMLLKMIPFVSGDISLLYQLKSELEADEIVLRISRVPPNKSISGHLDKLKIRLAKVKGIPKNELIEFNEYLDDIAFNQNNRIIKADMINILIKKFKRIINYYTIEYLSSVNLNPIDKSYLSSVRKYKENVINPNFSPENPIKIVDSKIMNHAKDIIDIDISNVGDKFKKIKIGSELDILNNVINRQNYDFNVL